MTTITSEDTIRAALYQRVSTSDQDAARQNQENRDACQRHGWQAAEYGDPGKSASRFARHNGREDWSRLLADITAGQVNVLVLWEPSRGDRQLAGWATVLDLCRRHGVLVHITSHHHTYDLSRAREWRSLAEDGIDSAYESEKLSVRIKSGKDYWLAQGHPQGSIAYGVHRVRDPEKTRHRFIRDEPDPVTGPVVARIIREVGRGVGYQQIADALNADGIPSPLGKRWQRGTIVSIAGNPVYAETAPPVVTKAESLTARARLADTKRKGERAARQSHRYGAVLACGKCGTPVRAGVRLGQPRYVCPQGCVSIATAEADPWIDALAIERLTQPDLIEIFRQPDDSAAAAFRAEAAGYRQKMRDAAARFAADKIDGDQLELITATLRPKAEAAEARAREAEMPAALAGLPDEDRALVRTRWESLTIPARKAALRILAPDAVICRPGAATQHRSPSASFSGRGHDPRGALRTGVLPSGRRPGEAAPHPIPGTQGQQQARKAP